MRRVTLHAGKFQTRGTTRYILVERLAPNGLIRFLMLPAICGSRTAEHRERADLDKAV
jgi:hypothetical protein